MLLGSTYRRMNRIWIRCILSTRMVDLFSKRVTSRPRKPSRWFSPKSQPNRLRLRKRLFQKSKTSKNGAWESKDTSNIDFAQMTQRSVKKVIEPLKIENTPRDSLPKSFISTRKDQTQPRIGDSLKIVPWMSYPKRPRDKEYTLSATIRKFPPALGWRSARQSLEPETAFLNFKIFLGHSLSNSASIRSWKS